MFFSDRSQRPVMWIPGGDKDDAEVAEVPAISDRQRVSSRPRPSAWHPELRTGDIGDATRVERLRSSRLIPPNRRSR